MPTDKDGMPQQFFGRDAMKRIAKVVRAAERDPEDLDRQGASGVHYTNPRTSLIRIQSTTQTAGMYPGAMQNGQALWPGTGNFWSDTNGGSQDCWLIAPGGLDTASVVEAVSYGTYQDGKAIFIQQNKTPFTPFWGAARLFYSGAALVNHLGTASYNWQGGLANFNLLSSGSGVSPNFFYNYTKPLVGDVSGNFGFIPNAISGSVVVAYQVNLQLVPNAAGHIIMGCAIGAAPGGGSALNANFVQLPVDLDSLGNFEISLPWVLDTAQFNNRLLTISYATSAGLSFTVSAAYVIALQLGTF